MWLKCIKWISIFFDKLALIFPIKLWWEILNICNFRSTVFFYYFSQNWSIPVIIFLSHLFLVNAHDWKHSTIEQNQFFVSEIFLIFWRKKLKISKMSFSLLMSKSKTSHQDFCRISEDQKRRIWQDLWNWKEKAKNKEGLTFSNLSFNLRKMATLFVISKMFCWIWSSIQFFLMRFDLF